MRLFIMFYLLLGWILNWKVNKKGGFNDMDISPYLVIPVAILIGPVCYLAGVISMGYTLYIKKP
ncbi:MAG: hypothetical protein K9L62_02045 [Vallitaleaceae bacterium]|nr:hypothetical protein [Vallitaleaceae bacterium]